MSASRFDTILTLAAELSATAAALDAIAPSHDAQRIAGRLYIEASLLAHEAYVAATTDEERLRAHHEATAYGRLGRGLLEGAPAYASLPAY